MLNFDFSEKGLAIVSPPSFVYEFSRKMFLIIFYYISKFHCLIAFTSGDIGKHVLQLFVSLAVMHKFLSKPDLSNQVIFLFDQKAKAKF